MSTTDCIRNKGCHSYNGNPQDRKNEASFDEKTLAIIEDGIHESVGHITVRDGDRMFRGTGFRVGKKCIMSTYSVFQSKIASVISIIATRVDRTKAKEQLLGITMETHQDNPFDNVVEQILQDFLRKHHTDFKLLLNELKGLIPDTLAGELAKLWKKDCIIKFTDERSYGIDWNVKFGNEENDIIILEFERIPGNPFPFPLRIAKTHAAEKDKNIYICRYGYESSTSSTCTKQIPIILKNCDLYNQERFEYAKKDRIEWWEKWKGKSEYDLKGEINFGECFEKECLTPYNKNTGVLITQPSPAFSEESSGSPMICLSSVGRPVVTGMFQGGLPLFYFKEDSCFSKCRKTSHHSLCVEHLFGKGIVTEKVAQLLDNYKKTDLKRDIFDNFFPGGKQKQTVQMKMTVSSWDDDNSCYDTKGVKATREKILSNNCVCVTGDAGSGKSMAIRNAALLLQNNQGFTIYPISSPDDFLTYLDDNKPQVFVIDDILGLHSLDKNLLRQWSIEHHQIKSLLCNETKLLVSLRKKLVQSQIKALEGFFFVDESKRIDLHNETYRLDNEQKKSMLVRYLKDYDINNDKQIVEDIWGTSGNDKTQTDELPDSFPLLCKIFCKDKRLRGKPKEFFRNPYSVLKDTFESIKEQNKALFSGLVLCVWNDGKLPEKTLDLVVSNKDNDPYEFEGLDDKTSALLRHLIERQCLPYSWDTIKAALLNCVYVVRIGDDFAISHNIISDVLTSVFYSFDFIFEHPTSHFVKDRVRISRLPDDDECVICCDKITKLATRLLRDLCKPMKTHELETEASLIVDNCNIDEDRLITCLREKLAKDCYHNVIITLFKQSFVAIHENQATLKQNKDGDTIIPQLKLIELLLDIGVDCNSSVDSMWPLHISVSAGSLQLTRLLIEKGADKRYCDSNNRSVIHLACLARRNNLELIKLCAKECIDKIAAIKVLANDREDIREWLDDQRTTTFVESVQTGMGKMQKIECQMYVQLEEVDPKGCNKVLTNDVDKVGSEAENYHADNKLQLVEVLHDSCLNSADMDKKTVLHLAVKYENETVLKEILEFGPKLTCVDKVDCQGRTLEGWLKADDPLPSRSKKIALFNKFKNKYYK